MQKMTEEIDNTTITRGSGNVFADLGFENPEEELLKARIASLLNDTIEAKNWTQTHTAKVLGISQPEISELSRGRLKHFSVERLINFLSRLDQRITITVQDEVQKDLPPHEIVIAAQALEKESRTTL